MKGQFDLTPELQDQIIFAMENQTETFLLDTESLLLVTEAQIPEERREYCLPIPDWNPSDGYQLMDSFTGVLRNPIYRERLRAILNSGRGVFRGFKNVLREREDLEKAWFAHKDREMKRRVRAWYDELCEYWGVESLGEEPEDMEDLFQDEFSMESFAPARGELEDVFKSFYAELYRELRPTLTEHILEQFYRGRRTPDIAFRALSPDGSSCAWLTMQLDRVGDDLYGTISALYVLPEYRGAGIASGLLDSVLTYAYENQIHTVVLVLPPEGEVLRANLDRRGFETAGPCMLLDVEHWFYEQQQ